MQTTTIASVSKNNLLASLNRINLQGGPENHEYPLMDKISKSLLETINNCELKTSQFKDYIKGLSALNTSNTIMGHILNKPYGYAGDFDIIDKIYLNEPISKKYSKWDKFSLSNAASIAVRNRKSYFKKLMSNKVVDGKTLQICDVASGPARDLKELFDLLKNKESIQATCVELDKRAISFASKLTEEYSTQINFVNKNVLRYSTDQKFDVVWSAGLFDYFNDKLFIRLLSRFMKWVKPGGEVVIGNFNSENNPSRAYMELFGEWYLNHRSPAEMRHLAIMAGANPHQITVEQEEEGINLFLRIKC